ncbi:MAG: Na/Pi symporter [bacterium]
MNKKYLSHILDFFIIVAILYLFLLSIKLLGHSFTLFGEGFAKTMLTMTDNPAAGLLIGIVTTSLIQSSSTTTSITVGLVAGGALSLQNAIPIIMGANIGTTITNSFVSLGHLSNRIEFRRAFAAGIVHDFFNICSVLVLFPLEIHFHLIAKSSGFLQKWFSQAGGMELFNPLSFILNPAIKVCDYLTSLLPFQGIILLILSLFLLFFSLTNLVKKIRSLVLTQIETVLNKYIFRNDLLGFLVGMLITAIVQSSSVTIALMIPLAGAGLLSLRKILPYTLGANIGTTVTTILAALATQNEIAIMVAFSHLCFNIFGIAIFYPLRFIPIGLAKFVSSKASKSKQIISKYIFIKYSFNLSKHQRSDFFN